MNIWQSLPFQPTLSHVCAHTNSQAIASQLNCLADHLATSSNSLSLPPPSLPLPTFFMDTYVPFSFSHDYIESNISSFTNSQLSIIDSANLNTFHEPVPSINCFDNILPPTYPYTKALSSYSAVIQLYLCSDQLDTSLSCSTHLKNDRQPWCRYRCPIFEDRHHIFIDCPQFDSLRTSHALELYTNINQIMKASSIPLPVQKFIQEQVNNLFLDSNIWPAWWSLFYLGILPPLFPPAFQDLSIHTHITSMCHTTSIRLASQIWGTVHCTYFKTDFKNKVSSNRSTITLPSILSHILPPSPSYPSFSVSFSWSLSYSSSFPSVIADEVFIPESLM